MNKSDQPNQAYMLDTNVFNHLLEGKISLLSFTGLHLLATGVQIGELKKTPDPTRRAELLAQFEVVNPTTIPATSFAFDIEGGWFWTVLLERWERKFRENAYSSL